jgi:hypothetical protein
VGGLFWLWLTLAPFVAAARAALHGDFQPAMHLAPWLALVVMGLWHALPWLNTGWRSALLFALVLGAWASAMRPPAPASAPADDHPERERAEAPG